MATERQLAAARANGAKSRGPRTSEGRRASSRNSRRHGFYARTSPAAHKSIDPESVAIFDRLVLSYHATFQPESPIQFCLIETMAAAWIEFSGAVSTQESMLQAEILRQAAKDPALDHVRLADRATTTLLDQQPVYALLFRRENRYYRHFFNALEHLLKMKERTARSIAEFRHDADAIAPTAVFESQSAPAVPIPAKPPCIGRTHHTFFKERTGFSRAAPSAKSPPTLWIHGAT